MLEPSTGGPAPGTTPANGGDPTAPTAAARSPAQGPTGWTAAGKAALGELAARVVPATRRERAWLVLLVAADVALIAAFVAYAYAERFELRDSFFYGRLSFSFVDGGYPEIWGYAKQVLIAALMLATWRAGRQPVHRALALLFTVTVLDDALALHENLGEWLAATAAISVRTGSLAAWGVIGIVPLLVVLSGYRQSDPRSRADAAAMLAGFAILLFFAVGMDLVHGVVGGYVSGFQTVLTLAEDGGELFTLTLLVLIALRVFVRRPVRPHPGADSPSR